MRAALLRISFVSVTLAAAVACAASGDQDEHTTPLDPDGGGSVLGDAGPPDAAPDTALPEIPICSPAGWCKTPFPDSDLWFRDMWTLSDRAFAMATSDTVGSKILEWDAVNQWSYIDDNQAQIGNHGVQTGIWAPNSDQVYEIVADYSAFFGPGQFGAIVYRGTRPVAPATKWAWEKEHLDCDAIDGTPQIWGSSSDDVYVVSCGQIHHRTSTSANAGADGGAGWAVEWVNDDPANPIELHGITGTGADDVWFLGSRGDWPGACTVLVHKTSAGYQTVVDGTPTPDGTCEEKPGIAMITGSLRSGFHAPAKNRFLGVRFTSDVDNDIVKVVVDDVGGPAQITTASPAATMDVQLTAVWGTSEDDLWVVATRTSVGGGGGILQATNVRDDAGTYQYSTLAINGTPNTRPLDRIRGTSNTNLWAVGFQRAFHKTTP